LGCVNLIKFEKQLKIKMKQFKKTITNILVSAAFLLTFGIYATAQTTLISPTGDGGFETGTTFAANGWTVVNAGTNNWQVGATTKNGGARSAYISNDGGMSNAYTLTTARTSHFYRDVAFPAGETNIQLSFAWKCVGSSGYDRLLVYTAPTSVTPVANSPFSPSTTLSGATLIATLNGQSSPYMNFTVSLPASFAGTTQRIIFTWQNDNSGGSNPPAAVDDISLISSALPTATNIVSTPIGGNWNVPTTWVGGFVPTATSNVTIVDTATVTIDTTTAVCANLNVGTGIGGTLQYITTPAGALTVNGDATVAVGASFNAGTGTRTNHVLNIGGTSNTAANAGNLIVDGTFDMNTTAKVTTNFFGSEDGAISGTGAIADFYSITINKGTTATGAVQDATRVITMDAPTANASRLTITNGTFKMSSASNVTPYFGSQTIAAATGRLWINNSSASITSVGVGTATGTGDATITGTLQVDAGTFGYSSGNGTMTVNGALIIGGSTATVNMFGSVNLFGTFTQTAGNFNVDPQAGNSIVNSGGLFIGDLATVNFTGGTLTIVDPGAFPASGSGNLAFYIAGATGAKNFDGSIIRFGDGVSSAPAGTNAPYFGISIPANVILGTVAVNNPIGTSRDVVITSQSSNTLNVRNFNLFAGTFNVGGRTFINHGNTSNNGVIIVGCALPLLCTGTLQSRGNISNNGVMNFGDNGTLSFFGSATPLSYSGTGTITAPLPNLTIDNPAGVSIDPNSPAITALNVNLRQGTVTNSGSLTLGNGGTTSATVQIGFAGSTEPGGSFDESPVFNVGTGGYRVIYEQESAARTTGFEIPPTRSLLNLTVNNTNGVTLAGGDLTATSAMTLTNGLVMTGANTLTHNGTATRTNGFVVGNLRRSYSAESTYVFFVGDNTGTAEYSPVTAAVTAGTFPSSLTVSAVDAVLPGLDPAAAASRYWNLTESGNLTATLTFNYLEADTPNPAVNSDETNFRVWRNNTGTLENKCPSAPCVNTTANTVTTPAGQTEFSPWGIGSSLAPTAASVSISGRVMIGNGRGLNNAMVILTDANGETRTAWTNPFGYYRFYDVAAGQTVIMTVVSKRFQFAPQLIYITEDLSEQNFVSKSSNLQFK
jgi:hypothetical protein